jgi:hypothetical protein
MPVTTQATGDTALNALSPKSFERAEFSLDNQQAILTRAPSAPPRRPSPSVRTRLEPAAAQLS